ncbi:hypothetical protein [Tenacibaculum soleae]|uniref:hypothetical protein n=1 Tax=Tenacibaculum soleae TaxID=447689 RepID=UPI0023009B69|nr:hypothetical protein [Tenacibaculum soleae]
MYKLYPYMNDILLGLEFFSALVALFYIQKLKKSYWKWFAVYLVFIFIQEFFWKFNSSFLSVRKQSYYAFIGIPFQYLFLYWLYAYKSLKNKKLFLILSFIYLLTFIPLELYNKKIITLYSINLTMGSIILIFLVVLEFIKQIKTDNILEFKENKMFYINIAIVLFYVGTYPFTAFYYELAKTPYIRIWNAYYLYFLISNCMMYLLFIASFIWGKHKS